MNTQDEKTGGREPTRYTPHPTLSLKRVCLYSHSAGRLDWKDWSMLSVCLPLMLHNIYRLFQISWEFEGWEVASTQDKVNIIWGAITIIFTAAVFYSYAIMVKLNQR